MSKYLVKGTKIFNGVIPRYEEATTYSSNEIKIGTWIDGKPLYRKVFSGSNLGTINVSSLHIDTGFIDTAHSHIHWYYRYTPIQTTSISNTDTYQYMAGAYLSGDKKSIIIEGGPFVTTNMGGYILTIEYTKTTD